MVVVTSTSSSLQSQIFTAKSPFSNLLCKPISPTSLLFLHQVYGNLTGPRWSRTPPQNSNGVLSVRAYIENPNSFSNFANRVIGALPVIGLVARILNDEGGLGGDIIDFAEFRRRVGKKCSVTDSRAFYEFQDRRGRVTIFIVVFHFKIGIYICVYSVENLLFCSCSVFLIAARQGILCMFCYAVGLPQLVLVFSNLRRFWKGWQG